jgi:hypothetical protein
VESLDIIMEGQVKPSMEFSKSDFNHLKPNRSITSEKLNDSSINCGREKQVLVPYNKGEFEYTLL